MKRQLPSLEDSIRILRTTHTRRAPKPPPPVSKQVNPLVKRLEAKFKGKEDPTGRLRNRWAEIVGERLAKLCEPVKLVRGRADAPAALEIRVMGAYATLLQHQSQVIIDRASLYLGNASINRLRITQGPLSTPQTKTAPIRPKPLTAQEELALQDQLADVTDDKLRKTLLKLGRSVMMRDKSKD